MDRSTWKPIAFVLLVAACAVPAASVSRAPAPAPPKPAAVVPTPVSLESLAPGQAVAGFTAVARYVDGDGRPRGARFLHAQTGFVFDYLQIESAPQAFLYATTYPTSDGGEPHTQEHLLLGRGNSGRFLGNFEHTHLARSSAFTATFRTAYHFNTSAGVAGFWGLLRAELQALVYPDYSDEEIRREVRDFGVATRPDGRLEIDEKGTVYNEMVRTFEAPQTRVWYEMRRLLYGPDHPLALSNGGTPEGIRGLQPEDIRRFHAAHYRLDNMGMIGAFPASAPLGSILEDLAPVLGSFLPKGPPPSPLVREADLPPAHGGPAGSLAVVEYPFATQDHPAEELFAWPANKKLDLDDRVLLQLFLSAFGGGGGSNLYKALVDGKTRSLDVGATAVWAWVSPEPGQPVYCGVQNVRPNKADVATLDVVRELLRHELQRVADLPDGSPELRDFGERMKARALEDRRAQDKMLDTPPEFGVRGTTDEWIELLTDVQRESGGFDKSLVRKRALERAMAIADETKNPWRERISRWGLLEKPYGLTTRASPALRARMDAERDARRAAEVTRLAAAYGASSPEEALGKRKAEIERADRVIADAEATVPMPALVADPPMTEDDLLSYRVETRRGVPVVVSTIETMRSATFALALRLDTVPERLVPFLAVLPAIIQDVGVLRDGKAIPYDEVRDRLRREVLGTNVYYATNYTEDRAELVFEASGNDEAETRRALGWIRDFARSPDLRAANLPRIRDVVAQRATNLHDVLSEREEVWLRTTQEAYADQDRPLLLRTGCALTRAYDAHRLGWLLSGAGEPFAVALERLGHVSANVTRASLEKLARDFWQEAGADSKHRTQAARELGQLLADIPEASLAHDWRALCHQMARDARSDPAVTLRELGEVLAAALHTGNARAWMVGSTRHEQAVAADVDALLASLDATALPKVSWPTRPHVLDRARERGATFKDASFVALVNPSTGNTSLAATAPLPVFDEPSDANLLDYLAANVFNGTGAHSFYKRIWGAGLAYSGYTWANPRSRHYGVYTDRCADLPQLMRFLGGVVRDVPADTRFIPYALARAFSSRVADSYESRARGIAADLADGFAPDRVRAFRERLLSFAQHEPKEQLAADIRARVAPVLSAVLPTLPSAAAPPRRVVSLAVGPPAQLAAYEAALVAARGQGTELVRLYPRDFWFVPPAAPAREPEEGVQKARVLPK